MSDTGRYGDSSGSRRSHPVSVRSCRFSRFSSRRNQPETTSKIYGIRPNRDPALGGLSPRSRWVAGRWGQAAAVRSVSCVPTTLRSADQMTLIGEGTLS